VCALRAGVSVSAAALVAATDCCSSRRLACMRQ
jgi:hypothetical protein